MDVGFGDEISGTDDLEEAVLRGDEQEFLGDQRLQGTARHGRSGVRTRSNSTQR